MSFHRWGMGSDILGVRCRKGVSLGCYTHVMGVVSRVTYRFAVGVKKHEGFNPIQALVEVLCHAGGVGSLWGRSLLSPVADQALAFVEQFHGHGSILFPVPDE